MFVSRKTTSDRFAILGSMENGGVKRTNFIAKVAMVGGSVSYLAGGKFGNGAATGAMQMAFNQLADHQAMKK